MATRTHRDRADALSSERIVEAAIVLLDAEGESALTFRALTARLSTGAGAIYHHVANKDELLVEATAAVIGRVMAQVESHTEARQAIRAISLGIFDAIDVHPWVGAQLSRAPMQAAVLHIWRGLGVQLQGLGLSGPALSDAGSALVNYVLGAAAQYAAGARSLPPGVDREVYLEALADQWRQHGPADDPFVQEASLLLREHDDRAQFLAGVNIFLAGITAAAR